MYQAITGTKSSDRRAATTDWLERSNVSRSPARASAPLAERRPRTGCWASPYSRERDASQCEKPTKKRMEAISTATRSGTETKPNRSKTRNGPTAMATQRNKTGQAKGCAKLMVHPIQRRRRGTITRGSSAHRYTMLQLFGLAQSRSRSSQVTAEALYDAQRRRLSGAGRRHASAAAAG